jgi:hypothetical protein
VESPEDHLSPWTQGARPGASHRPGPLASPPEVLLIGYSADRDLAAVSDMFFATGIPSLLWLYDANAEDLTVDARPGAFRLQHGEAVLSSEDFARARIVVHRIGLGHWRRPVAAPTADGPERDFTEREWASLLHGLFLDAEQRYPHLIWLNPPAVSAVTSEKYHLLASADLDGLTVPDLRVSNEGELPPSASGQYVCKAVGEDESIDDSTTYCTAVLDAQTLEELPFRTNCPSLIQERVLADHELRAYYLLGETRAVRIHTTRRDYADLRLVPRNEWSVQVTGIAPELHDAVRRYCERRHLNYCCFDFLRTVDGRDLLIDVTPSGTWSHLESPDELVLTRWYVETLARLVGERRHSPELTYTSAH